jgi:hypothetical protein
MLFGVRELARAAGVLPTIVQGLKSCKKMNVTLATVSKVLGAIGYQLTIEPKVSKDSRLLLHK